MATRFIERERESKFQAATDAAQWLNDRLAEQRAAVAKAETALQDYRATNDAMGLLERQNIIGQQMLDLNAAVTRAKTERLQKETQYQQIQAIRNDPAALESHPLITANAFVQTLRAQVAELTRQDAQLAERLGPKHPDRIQVADRARVGAGTAAGRDRQGGRTASMPEYRTAVAQENSLAGALNSQKAAASNLDRKGVAYAALEREAISARQVFDTLLQQTKEAVLTSSADSGTVRVIDPAEPPGAPIRPRRSQGLAAAGAAGDHRRGGRRLRPRVPAAEGALARRHRAPARPAGAGAGAAGAARAKPTRPPACRRCLARPSAGCAPTSCWPAATTRSRATCWS